MWQVTLAHPWLIVDFPRPVTCLGWTPQSGGQVRTRSLLWREVRNEDLSLDFDVLPWLAAQTEALGHPQAPCFLTSAQVAHFALARAEIEGAEAQVLVTAGLGNAERIGTRATPMAKIGTINAALMVNRPLSPAASLEALSLLAEARTTAMLEHAPRLWSRNVTGTGTDCLALCFEATEAAPLDYTGKHTAMGEAIGAAALKAFSTAIGRWTPPA